MPARDRTYRLDARAIGLARVPREAPLCLALSAWGGTFAASEEPPPEEMRGGSVAVVSISGPLAQEADELCGWYDGYGGETGVTARVLAALNDANVGAVVLRFDSPGGTSAGLEEAIRRMCEARDASGKPIVAHADEQCCSAAYWIAATVATSGLYAPRSCAVGSIGSWIAHLDESEALAKEGLAMTIEADPPGKVAGNQFEPLNDVGRARMKRDVRACTARFVEAVASARGIKEDDVRSLDGDVLEGPPAASAGLLDGIGSFEDVVALALSLAAAKPGASEFEYGGADEDRQTPHQSGEDMPISRSTREALGLNASVTDAAAEATAIQLAGLGRHAMTVLGAKTPEAARGMLEASVMAAAEVPGLRTQLSAASAASEESTRFALLEQAIRDGKPITPALAFTFDVVDDPETGKPMKQRRLSAWASAPHKDANGRQVGQTLDQLRAFIASLPGGGLNVSNQETKPKTEVDEADDAQRAAAAGVTADSYRRAKKMTASSRRA